MPFRIHKEFMKPEPEQNKDSAYGYYKKKFGNEDSDEKSSETTKKQKNNKKPLRKKNSFSFKICKSSSNIVDLL